MSLTGFALKNNVTLMVLTLMMCVYGLVSFKNLPKQQDPGFTIRAAVVTTRFPGANPIRVEQLVSDKIEKAIQEIPELDNVTSESTQGLSYITANFKEKYKDMRPLFDKLRRKVDDITDLPAGIQGPMINDEFGDVYGIVYSLTGDGYNFKELKDFADNIRDNLLKFPQIAKVKIDGEVDEVINVEYNNARLKELGLSPLQLSNTLQVLNILQPGGDILLGDERITLEPTGNFESIDQIKKAVIQLPDSSSQVYLSDIANVYRGYKDPPDSLVRSNGKPAIGLAISMAAGENLIELGKLLDTKLPEILAVYPHGVELNKVYFSSTAVELNVKNFMNNLLQAIGIVMLVMLLFLGLRTGLIVSSLIPLTILLAFVVMAFFNISINTISLAALIIALGLLVDNAIVMVESIMVHRENGVSASEAAAKTGNEMAVPLLTSSLTTCAAFLCIYLAESAVGEYTSDIFKVVTIALMVSWLMAMTVVPLLTVLFLKINKTKAKSSPFAGKFYHLYRSALLFCVRNKVIFIIIVLALFYLGIQGLKLVPKVFIPSRTDPVISAEFNLPFGSALETTQKMVGDIENYWLENLMHKQTNQDSKIKPGIVNWMAFIGQSIPRYELTVDPGSNKPHASKFIINTSSEKIISNIIQDTTSFVQTHYPDAEIIMKKLENGTPISYPIQIRVYGSQIDQLYQLVGEVKSQLMTIPGVSSVNDDWGSQSKKLIVQIDQDRALRAGVNSEDVAVSLESNLSGIELTEFREDDQLIPITLRTSATERQDIGKLDNITVFSSSGESVPLKQVADILIQWQNGIIIRRDRDRVITVQAQLSPGITANQVGSQIFPWLDEQHKQWPVGYFYEIGGESETSGDANQAIADKLPISMMIIILLLVSQFNSIRKPLIILATIPLGIIGITMGLILANSIFGFFTVLGLISLSGIIINNAIVLIDRINIEILENNLLPADAIIQAAQQRLRPILLTTATTVGGMLPLWISRDPMFETMAVSIIFGLLFATLLTLAVVPVLYSTFFKVDFSRYQYKPV